MFTHLWWISKFISTDTCNQYCFNGDSDFECSDQGWCDTCTGICNCYKGYEGYNCQGKNFLCLTNER